MALKSKLLATAFNALPADVKSEYKLEGDVYVLDVEELDALPAVVSMKEAITRAKQNEVTAHNETKRKLVEASERIEVLETSDKSRTNDTKTLEDKHKKALEAKDKEYGDKITVRDRQLSDILVDNEALKIANEISTAPELILPHIKARLQADLSGDKPVTVVLGKDGQPSTMKIEELSKEFVANKNFSAIIQASKASGSGARQSGNGGGAGDYKGKKFNELSEAERTQWAKEDAAGFQTASAENQRIQRGY